MRKIKYIAISVSFFLFFLSSCVKQSEYDNLLLSYNELIKENEDLKEQLQESESKSILLVSELSRIQEQQKAQNELIYIYATVNCTLYAIPHDSYTRKRIVNEGLACSKVFKIKRANIPNFKQSFFSSTEVQYSSKDDVLSLFRTYPETVKIEAFSTMEEASNSQMNMKNRIRVLNMFNYNDFIGF